MRRGHGSDRKRPEEPEGLASVCLRIAPHGGGGNVSGPTRRSLTGPRVRGCVLYPSDLRRIRVKETNVAADARIQRRAFYDRIGAHNMTPLWEVLGALVPRQPDSPAQAALWQYSTVRERVLEAGRIITAAEAERRVLILENPGLQ